VGRPGPIVTRSFATVTPKLMASRALTPPTVTTARPSMEFQRHHDIEAPRVGDGAFRQGARVRSWLRGLLADSAIATAEWQAEHPWQGWAETNTPTRHPALGSAHHATWRPPRRGARPTTGEAATDLPPGSPSRGVRRR